MIKTRACCPVHLFVWDQPRCLEAVTYYFSIVYLGITCMFIWTAVYNFYWRVLVKSHLASTTFVHTRLFKSEPTGQVAREYFIFIGPGFISRIPFCLRFRNSSSKALVFSDCAVFWFLVNASSIWPPRYPIKNVASTIIITAGTMKSVFCWLQGNAHRHVALIEPKNNVNVLAELEEKLSSSTLFGA